MLNSEQQGLCPGSSDMQRGGKSGAGETGWPALRNTAPGLASAPDGQGPKSNNKVHLNPEGRRA